MYKRICIVRPFAVDDRKRRRQLVLHLVVVRHDDVHALGDQLLDGLGVRDAAVHGDQKVRFFTSDALQKAVGDAVALAKAVRDHVVHVRADLPEEDHEDRSRGHAVRVVVAADQDLLVISHRPGDALDGRLHVVHQERIVPFQCFSRKKGLGIDPAAFQKALKQRRRRLICTRHIADIRGLRQPPFLLKKDQKNHSKLSLASIVTLNLHFQWKMLTKIMHCFRIREQ